MTKTKKNKSTIIIVALILFAACALGIFILSDTMKLKSKPETINKTVDIAENGGADFYNNIGDHADSQYYVNPDFYNMQSTDCLTIIEHFKTYQQTSEWSCGNAAALMVLENYGVSQYNEMDIARLSGSHRDHDVKGSEPGTASKYMDKGTSVKNMFSLFSQLGFEIVETSYREEYAESELIPAGDVSSPEANWGNLYATFQPTSLYASDNNPNTNNWVGKAKDSYFVQWLLGHLSDNRPIMVEWADWDGHWQVIIGYDTTGTDTVADDILIFADPYDTSDHWQDGYYYYPLERWFKMWNDRCYAPKPFQLQPYIIVEPANAN